MSVTVENTIYKISPPQTVQKSTIESFSKYLNDLDLSADLIEKRFECEVVTSNKIEKRSGSDSWKVFEQFSYDEIYNFDIKLLLIKSLNPYHGCEAHIKFNVGFIKLSVSDIGTGLGKALYDRVLNQMNKHKIFKGELLGKVYELFLSLQNLVLIMGASFLVYGLLQNMYFLAFSGMGFCVAGSIPSFAKAYKVFYPPAPRKVIDDKPVKKVFSLEKLAIVVSIVSGVINLLFLLFNSL